jgi:hypothetical protein
MAFRSFESVTAPLFDGHEPFFLALDKVQVSYDILRACMLDGVSGTAAAEQDGYSRAALLEDCDGRGKAPTSQDRRY